MTKTRKHLRLAVSGFMTVWLSGIVFLVFCATMASAAEKEHCPLAKMSAAHCEKSKASGHASLQPSSKGIAFDCCGFIPAVFDKARKLQANDPVVAPALIAVRERIDLRPIVTAIRHRPVYRGVVATKNRTYLKNQTFRI